VCVASARSSVPVLVGAVVLSSCGGGETAATQSTIDLSSASTAFVVRPPATTEPPADTAGDPDAVVEGTQEYTVQSGDYPFLLVERFDVTLEDLLGVNEWTNPNQFPGPGTVILIPPGGRSVAAATAHRRRMLGGHVDASPGAATETIPDAGDNCAPGTYTIVKDDFPGRVASKFDVTVEALNAANANTSGYSSFYVGLEIVIPAKSDC
jgi:LysM repeat protein